MAKFKQACMAVKAMMKYDKAKSKSKQANAANAISALLRSKQMKIKCAESVTIREAKTIKIESKEGIREGHVVDVVLITEGLGNRRNMNYYGPEAIDSAPPIFEGKPCFLDHPSESEERDIPERRVRQKCGYFKNCRVESAGGATACIGELHFDLSDDGEQAYLKACTALHYKDEFPGVDSEYVGLSINADGDVEDRTVQWEGETLQVNYVTRFRDAMSCDLVTSPARGGRFLALVESAAGANPKTKEVGPMKKGLQKSLEAAQTALNEAEKEKDLDKKATKVAEAKKLFDSFMKEAAKAAYQDESKESEDEDETESEDGESEDKADESEGDSHTTTTHKVVKKTGKAAVPDEDEDEADDAGDDKKKDDDDDKVESNRIAILSMAKESGLELSKTKLEKLVHGSLKEAKEEIADLKWMQEAIVKRVVKQIKVPVATLSKVTESGNNSNESSDDFLASCIR